MKYIIYIYFGFDFVLIELLLGHPVDISDCNYLIGYISIIYTLLSLLVITSILGNSLVCLAVTTDPNLRLSKNTSKHTAASNIPTKMEGLKKNVFLL